MDEKELDQNEQFDLDSILNEFHEDNPEAEPEEADLDALLAGFPQEEAPPEESTSEEVTEEVPESSEAESSEEPMEAAPLEAESPMEEAPEEAPILEVFQEEGPSREAAEETGTQDSQTQDSEEVPFEEDASEEVPEEGTSEESDFSEEEEVPSQPHLVYDPQAKLRELKHKLVNGPEKRYYALSELGVGKLQVAIFINILLVLFCTVGAVSFAAGRVPENRMRLLIFTQVLSMLISGLLGINLMLDGFSEIFKGRFSIDTMLSLTFLACMADALFSLRDLRVPCCCAFCLQMFFALSARCQKRNTEMGQMDTLRKAVRLRSLKKVADYHEEKAGFVRCEGELEDFMDSYQKSSTPQKLQSFYCFMSFLLCIGIAVLAGMLHGVSMAVQIFATSLLVAVPASFFISLTRPAAILERRLHMVGSVLCGWTGVKGLSGKAAFPITDTDLFPLGSTKLNGVKFYSDRDPDMIVSYTSSLILESGSGLTPIFEQLMNSRGVVANPVYNFRLYEGGGMGGEVCGETVLLGSPEFLQSMEVHVPEGSQVSQAVYAAIDGELCAVVAVTYAKMRSAAAGMVTLCGYRKLTPIFVGCDFLLSEEFVREKFDVKTRRLLFPSAEQRMALLAKEPEENQPGLAISTRADLVSFAYAVTGARALRSCLKHGVALHLIGGILGLLTMLALAITGSTELLTPINILLYQLIWMVPGFLITEWVRHV